MTTTAQPKEVPAEHVEAYSEIASQFRNAVLSQFRDLQHVTLMRDMPPSLQLNTCLTGAIVGGLIPILLLSRKSDREIMLALQQRMPEIVAAARQQADHIGRELL